MIYSEGGIRQMGKRQMGKTAKKANRMFHSIAGRSGKSELAILKSELARLKSE